MIRLQQGVKVLLLKEGQVVVVVVLKGKPEVSGWLNSEPNLTA